MGRSCSRVSSRACLQPKVLTQTLFPPYLPRPCTCDVPALAQKRPQARGKIRAGRGPLRHYTPMELASICYRRWGYPSPPPPRSNPYLSRPTHVDNPPPRLTLAALGSIQPTFIRVLRCQWIRSFWIPFSSCQIQYGKIHLCQVSLASLFLSLFFRCAAWL